METICLLVAGLYGQLLHLGLVQIAILDGDCWDRQCIFFGTPAKPQMHSPSNASTEISIRLPLVPSFPGSSGSCTAFSSKEQLNSIQQYLKCPYCSICCKFCRWSTLPLPTGLKCPCSDRCANVSVIVLQFISFPLEITPTFSCTLHSKVMKLHCIFFASHFILRIILRLITFIVR